MNNKFLTCCRMFFLGGLASHFVKACLLFREIQTSHFGNPRSLILEIPDHSLWKIRTS